MPASLPPLPCTSFIAVSFQHIALCREHWVEYEYVETC